MCARSAATGGSPTWPSWGRRAGDPEVIRWGELANAHEPELHRYDRFGHRIDTVEYHPAYHALMTEAVAGGLHAAPWADDRPGAHVVRAARFAVWTQVEAGHGCPISMTYSIVPALRADAELAAEWEPRLTSSSYDQRDEPAADKRGALAGMAMTEKQGGSDVRANTTRAAPADGGYVLTGHKWFCSAPMSDLFLMLAQTARRAVLLRRAPLAPRRHPQRDPHRAAQGQARQPLQRVERDRARRRVGHAPRRRGRRRGRRSSGWSTTPASTA